MRVADKDAALENMGVQNAIAEAEASLADEGRVLVRKSGTESVIRVLAGPRASRCRRRHEAHRRRTGSPVVTRFY